MDENSIRENITFRIHHLLLNNGIKLWCPPYYQQGSSDLKFNDEIVKLAKQYQEIVNADFEVCAEILLELQDKSLRRLRDREKFKTEGLATICVKVSGQNTTEFSVNLRLTDSVEMLRQSIADRVDISSERLKLIANGKILKTDQSLEQQAVKNGNTVLVIVLPSVTSSVVGNVDERILQETIKDLEFLTQKAKIKNIFSVTNQSGHFLNLPETNRQHLLYAMTLHEKGRSAFKRGTYSLALIFYLEAENEFKLSHCDLLDKVDNYGLLNLDIVWCYLHLNSVHYLPDAEKRLQICDETFRKCYGPNLERLKLVKGTSGNESVLLLRLHLLQAILHHLLNRNEIAREKFKGVESELKKLRVDDDKIMNLITQLNCTPKEARLGLRASYNDPDAAFDFILQQRELRKRRRAVEKIKRITDYCICEDGTPVDPEKVKQLVEMGYSLLLAIEGLKNSKNDIDNTIIWISNYIENLKNLYPSFVVDVITSIDINSLIYLSLYRSNKYKLNEACIAKFIAASLGFEKAKELFPNVDLKIATSLGTSSSTLDANPGTSTSLPVPFPPAVPSTSSVAQSLLSSSILQNNAINAEALRAQDPDYLSTEEHNAFERIKNDMDDTTDDYLDTTLESEENFFIMYKSLLN